ncbi:propionyl-CoA carboxylase [Perilla frutescens var. hirtella]|uniref:Propionyl-CoA carboxylase n=1 Tax=Perilla frutescens var. hirtella TaxID=608512 RepID=A0AAD4IWR2_PERFH|nr:propionyl-CoA carboxylase [Perilla frutescens var. hirtella]
MKEFGNETREPHNCVVNLRRNPVRRKEKVVIGCGAGFAGDPPAAALKLLQRVKELDYLVLECLAECTLVERYRDAKSGGKGYDPRSMSGLQLNVANYRNNPGSLKS